MAAAALGLGPASGVRGQPVEPYELEAAFLYNFTKFVSWPESAFDDESAPFRICLVGGDERLASFLARLVDGERVDRRPIEVRRHERVRDSRRCQIVFVPAGHDPGHLPSTLGDRTELVLTVGESEGFLAAGGMLQFHPVDNKLRLRLNDRLRSTSRLRMSSKLLQLCERVRPGRDDGPGTSSAGER